MNKGLEVIISLYKTSGETLLEMLSTILGTSLKTDKRNQCKEQEQKKMLYRYIKKKKYATIIFFSGYKHTRYSEIPSLCTNI